MIDPTMEYQANEASLLSGVEAIINHFRLA